MTFVSDDSADRIADAPIFTPPPANAGGRDGADRGPLADLLAMLAGRSDVALPAGLAGRFRQAVTGVIWDPAAVRATTDLARGLALGEAVTLDAPMLDRMAAQMAFRPASGLSRHVGRNAEDARLAAALVILAFAAGQAGRPDGARIARAPGGQTVAP